jgi:hypothetical protein
LTPAASQVTGAPILAKGSAKIPVDKWYELIGDSTYADAILDGIVPNAHRINLSPATACDDHRNPHANGSAAICAFLFTDPRRRRPVPVIT